ncbi:MAG: cytochrome b/b6 domain-containing protein [Gulosibacter sp.]|uniref:cytochrome b/b6 domain-containing protein n=1 Tax=Gulosibacter sp. TaxID=2817531 RepID=UPI003F92A9C6
MATYSTELRRGLPRQAGGEAWPPAGSIPETTRLLVSDVPSPEHLEAEVAAPIPADDSSAGPAPAAATTAAAVLVNSAETISATAPVNSAETVTVHLRRGLPRVVGGEAWPPEGTVEAAQPPRSASSATSVAETAASPVAAGGAAQGAHAASEDASASSGAAASAADAVDASSEGAAPSSQRASAASDVPLRRGLPRTVGGDPWPPAGFAPVLDVPTPASAPVSPASAPKSPASAPTSDKSAAGHTKPASVVAAPQETTGQKTIRKGLGSAAPAAPKPALPQSTEPKSAPAKVTEPKSAPAETEATALAAVKPAKSDAAMPAKSDAAMPAKSDAATPKGDAAAPKRDSAMPKREPITIGSRTLGQWARLVVLGVLATVAAAAIIVLAARGVTTLPGVPEFLERYPGEYALPAFVEEGFPAWARWTHFLNFFFLVLIVRTGIQVRRQQKPDAFYTPKRGGKKVSIYLWLHTSLDVLWLLNGIVFVVLLFVTGHWARIVPTSWEVFPNAASAMLQYLTLEWPVEDGWVNYNSLQQLMYFLVVFVAAPLSVITGVRMSEWWPKNAKTLNKIYPAPVARALHYPTMLFFVLFVIAHVFLVFATGALKNLNHMFAGTPEVSWVGFWWFVGALLAAVAAVFAAKPLVLAPIANLFGRVSSR